MHNRKDNHTMDLVPRNHPDIHVAVERERHTITASLIKRVLDRQADILDRSASHACPMRTADG